MVNLKKIMRLNFHFQNLMSLLVKNRHFFVIALKLLKMIFIFKCAMLVTNV